VLRTCGVAESALADQLGPVEEHLAPATLAYLPSLDGVDLRLTVWNVSPEEADGVLRRGADRLKDILGDRCYGEGDTDLAAVVLARGRTGGVRVAVAESCTGGLVGARLTAIPGASQTFVGGIIAYDDTVKLRELDVPRDMLARQGAVSEEVVRAMASGVRSRYGVDAALAISGIAGPDGGTPDKPVGTVWLCAQCGEECRAVRIGFPGDRGEVRARAAQAGLDLLRSVLPSDGIKFQPS
jgi:nicotinamide-nucleotide amidase